MDDYGLPAEALEDAPPDTETAIGVFPNPDLDACPVVPLGFDGAHVVFAMPEGELRMEPASKIGALLRTDIFACAAGQGFLANWRDNEGKLQRDLAAVWFVRKCREAGKWDRKRPIRGYGLWPSEVGPILHAGDQLLQGLGTPACEATSIADALRAGGSGPVWRLLPPLDWRRPAKGRRPPLPQPAGVDVGKRLREAFGMWNWPELEPGGLSQADVALGWFGQALLAGCSPFRAHLLLTGIRGTGKTTFSKLLHAAASANAGDLQDSFTEAGLRAALAGESRPVFLDEAEPSPDGAGPVERAFELLRRMSTGDGSARIQSDMGGGVVSQSAIGAVYLGAIYEPKVGDAMASRMVSLRLRPLGPAKGGQDERLRAAIEWAREISPSLLARVVREAGRFRADVGRLKDACGQLGLDPRSADLVSVLAAGLRLLLSDEALSAEEAVAEMSGWAALVRARAEAESTLNPGQEALQHLLAHSSGKHWHDRLLTIGECVRRMIEIGPRTEQWSEYEGLLKTLGLKVALNPADSPSPGPWLIVANQHPALQRIFAGSQAQNWRAVLMHLEALGDEYKPVPMKRPERFGYHKVRALAVPLTPWLDHPVGIAGTDEISPFDNPDRPTWSQSGVPTGGVDA